MEPLSAREAAAIEHLREQGYAVLPAAADEGTLHALRTRLEALVSGALPDPGLFFQRDAASGRYADVVNASGWEGPDVPYRKIDRMELDPVFAAWVANPLFERVARAMLPAPIRLYRAVAFSKAARCGSETPWHQDGGQLWGLSRVPSLQFWTALDEATAASGCLEVVPGSHREGLATALGGLVPPAWAAERDADARAVALPARPGDVILLDNLVWHRSGTNRTDAPRRALTVSVLDADIRCVRKRHAPRVFRTLWP